VNHKIREYKHVELREKNKAVRMMLYPAAEQRDSSHILASMCKVRKGIQREVENSSTHS
jgi:hypothetical protein